MLMPVLLPLSPGEGTGSTVTDYLTDVLAAPVVGHVFGQPFVPSRFNLAYRLHLTIISRAGFDKGDDSQMSANDVRVGTLTSSPP